MTETQKRIEAYQKVLPDIKEKVAAVAMLLALSVIMLTSASFAWLTISRAPEVTQVKTTIAANGNLEIALATGDGTTPPEESKVRDSAATANKDIMDANTTWGNLINLNDPRYGLDNLALRPATLNTAKLITEPLVGAKYGADGRISDWFTDFEYMSWVPETEGVPGYFGEATEVGIRAISSMKREMKDLEKKIYDLGQTADAKNGEAASVFSGIVNNTGWMDTLARLLGIHMTATMNTETIYKNASVDRADVNVLRAMYGELIKTHEIEAEAIAALINLQYLRIYGGNTEKYTDVTADYVLNKIDTFVTDEDGKGDYVIKITDGNNGGVQKIVIKNLEAFIADYELLKEDYKRISDLLELDENGNLVEGAQNRQSFLWTGDKLNEIVERLMIVDKCLMKKKDQTAFYTIEEFSNDYIGKFGIGTLYSMYRGAEVKVDIRITNGVLFNLEQRIGTNIGISGMKVKATVEASSLDMIINGTIIADVDTSAAAPYYYNADRAYADSIKTEADNEAGVATAEDTYAMVIDLWVRTNTDNSVLVLEGGAIIESREETVTGKDINGNIVDIYTMTRTFTFENEEGTSETKTDSTDVYYIGDDLEIENGTRTWYRALDNYEYKAEDIPKGTTFIPKVETVDYVVGYEGENRIWNREDGFSQPTISTDSATQGSGSCYVFYADTPEDQARSLELLKSLEVAFVDRDGGEEGKHLATAKMDTEHYYAKNGRVIVPLFVAEGGVVIGDDSADVEENIGEEENTGEGENTGEESTGEEEKAETKRGITELVKNEARKITAIVYLDGEEVDNKEVLSAANIQGQLNIQFGTDTKLVPAENEDLSQKTRTVSAYVDKSEFKFDGEEPLEVTVTVNVEGDQPKNLRAFFIRKINDTQGSKETEMTFDKKEGSETEWIATYTFTAPGTYVLRTVKLDGQEYVLDVVPEVVIEGFTINEVGCSDLDLGERRFYVMTGENYHISNITVRFASSKKMPDKVLGRFNGPDNSTVDVPFSYNVTSGVWTGNAKFEVSGEYKLQYIILDGVYEELAPGLQITAEVKLGIKVKVTTTQYPTSFLFDEKKPETLGMRVNIYDNTNNEMTGLEKVDLYYKPDKGMGTMDAPELVWTGKYYEGVFETEEASPGRWVFSHVKINNQYDITKVVSSPVFEMVSPNPPRLTEEPKAIGYIFAPKGDAKMTVKIDHSNTATVAAIITNGSETFEVQGKDVDSVGVTTIWNFPIPKKQNKQDGNWEMKEVRIWNYYDIEKGGMVSAEVDEYGILVPNGKRDEPLVFGITGYKEKVVQTPTITLSGDYSSDTVFGVDGSGNTVDLFMTEHTISGLKVKIEDFEQKAITGISNIKLNLSYQKDSELYGGYSIKNLVDFDDNSIDFTVVTGTTEYPQSTAKMLQYAGTYKANISFSAGGQSYTDSKSLTYTVKSVVPKVKITSVAFREDKYQPDDVYNSFTDTYATVYFGYEKGTYCGSGYVDYPHSSVTIGLTGIGSATEAKLTFSTTSNNGSVYMYTKYMDEETPNNSTYETNSFVWTPSSSSSSLSCQRWIGLWEEAATGPDTKVTAGLLKATELVLTYDGKTFTVPINKMYSEVNEITINNPG